MKFKFNCKPHDLQIRLMWESKYTSSISFTKSKRHFSFNVTLNGRIWAVFRSMNDDKVKFEAQTTAYRKLDVDVRLEDKTCLA